MSHLYIHDRKPFFLLLEQSSWIFPLQKNKNSSLHIFPRENVPNFKLVHLDQRLTRSPGVNIFTLNDLKCQLLNSELSSSLNELKSTIIIPNVARNLLSLSSFSSLLDIHYNIKKEGEEKRRVKKKGEIKSSRETRVKPTERGRNLKKLENRRTRGKRWLSPWTGKADRRIFHPDIRSRPESGQVQLLPKKEREREKETWRNQANKSNPPPMSTEWQPIRPRSMLDNRG